MLSHSTFAPTKSLTRDLHDQPGIILFSFQPWQRWGILRQKASRNIKQTEKSDN